MAQDTTSPGVLITKSYPTCTVCASGGRDAEMALKDLGKGDFGDPSVKGACDCAGGAKS